MNKLRVKKVAFWWQLWYGDAEGVVSWFPWYPDWSRLQGYCSPGQPGSGSDVWPWGMADPSNRC